eukprot:s663_g15.t1
MVEFPTLATGAFCTLPSDAKTKAPIRHVLIRDLAKVAAAMKQPWPLKDGREPTALLLAFDGDPGAAEHCAKNLHARLLRRLKSAEPKALSAALSSAVVDLAPQLRIEESGPKVPEGFGTAGATSWSTWLQRSWISDRGKVGCQLFVVIAGSCVGTLWGKGLAVAAAASTSTSEIGKDGVLRRSSKETSEQKRAKALMRLRARVPTQQIGGSVALPGGKRPGSAAVAAAGAAAVKAQSMAVASGKAPEKLRLEELPGKEKWRGCTAEGGPGDLEDIGAIAEACVPDAAKASEVLAEQAKERLKEARAAGFCESWIWACKGEANWVQQAAFRQVEFEVLTDPLVLQIDQIIRQRQEELFHRLSHALESLRAGGAVRSGTMETVDSLSAVNLPIKSDDWHNVLQTGGRLEDCGVKLQTLQEEADKIPGAEAARVSVDPRSRKRKAQGAKKKRWQEEEYEALADERSRRRAQRTASGDETEEKPVPAKQTWTSLLANWVNSKNFEGIFAAVIFSNSIFLGVSLEYESGRLGSNSQSWIRIIGLDLPPIFKVFDLTYAALFTLELLLKIWVDGRNFFCTQDRGMIFWNYLDLTIVCTSMVEVIFDILLVVQAGGDGDSARIAPTNLIRVVRIVRVLRVMRVIKVVKFIAGLTSLISSILSTLKSLLWSLLLLLMVMYVFGILFTDTVIGYISLHNLDMVAEGSMEADLLTHFGSLHLSMHTLFRAVTGGVDWGDMANLLIYINWIWGYFFTGYIAFSYFAVLNVMTAVFCKRAIESAEQDEQNIMQRFHEDQKRSRKCIEQLFHIFDGLEADGAITLCELEMLGEKNSRD